VTVVIGTAGHIDHGKTTLLQALTGIDADRLPEEQRRGMTIDVGYAHMTLPDGRELDFVDVPGHDRLIGNMLVGAGEIDAALFVVAADEGPRAQTIEHLELIAALGIADAVVAITKADLVRETRIDAVEDQVRRLLASTGLDGSPMVRVSGTSGEGIPELTEHLADMAAALERAGLEPVADDPGRPARLPIDRVFSVKGRGVVVTGTLRGAIGRADRLRLVPGDREAVVREVQVHGQEVAAAGHGRTALNLRGVEAADLRRGMVLTTDAALVASDRMLVAVRVPSSFGRASRDLPADHDRLRLHLGTDQVDVRVGRAGRESTTLDDGRVTAILRLDRSVASAAGDRFVLRRPSAHLSEAGGVVLDPLPPVGAARRRATPDRLAALVTARSAIEHEAALMELHGARMNGRSVTFAADMAEGLRVATLDRVRRHHEEHPSENGAPVAALRSDVATELRRATALPARTLPEAAASIVSGLIGDGLLAAEGDRVRLPDYRPAVAPGLGAAMDRLESILAVASPPPLAAAAQAAGCAAEGIRALERDGRIVRLDDDLAWAADAYGSLAKEALRLAATAALTPAMLRDATGTSRKYVMAILEDLDRRGILRRTAEGHVPGPRAATLGAAAGPPPVLASR
jgi:selenocysteine-specific elongation factor